MRRRQSSSIVFLTELFLSLTIFALCASVCAGLFSWSHRLSRESGALNRAVNVAQSCAEACKRSPSGAELAGLLGGAEVTGGCAVYYDADWRVTDKAGASFVMQVRLTSEDSLAYAEIVVRDTKDAVIFRLETSSIRGAGRT